MATQEDANLILKLYELRREEKLRKAREWFGSQFRPQSTEDVIAALNGENSALFRMVGSYWDMVAALVNHGAVNRELFYDTNGEHIFVYAKMQPFLADLRKQLGVERLFLQLEKLVQDQPDGAETVARLQARWAAEAAKQAATA